MSDIPDLPPGVKFVGMIDPHEINFDPENANLGTERGRELIKHSIEKYGAARGIVLDANNIDLAGNKTLEGWLRTGKPIVVVETEGDVLVATRRRDWDSTTDAEPKEYAIVDNRAPELNLSWDYERLTKIADLPGISLDMAFRPIEMEDIRAHITTPTLDALEEEWGEPTDDDFLNPFKLMLPQDVIDRYYDLVTTLSGAPDEKFAKILDWAEVGRTAEDAAP